jgi:hypothetical protein
MHSIEWEIIFYIIFGLGVMTYMQKVLDIRLQEFFTHIFREIGGIASDIKSRESINGLLILAIVALIMLFCGSYIAKELSEMLALLKAGTTGHHQPVYIGIFAILTLAVTGLLSIVATRKH